MALEQITPTRQELLRLRRRIRLIERGVKLLEEKKEALSIIFRDTVRRVRILRKKLYEQLRNSFQIYGKAVELSGRPSIERVAREIGDIARVEVRSRLLMGLRLPLLHVSNIRDVRTQYSLIDSNAYVDQLISEASDLIKLLCEVASVENALVQLGIEIARTRRKVNALNCIILPRMKSALSYIELFLSERERESFTALKHIKQIKLGRRS